MQFSEVYFVKSKSNAAITNVCKTPIGKYFGGQILTKHIRLAIHFMKTLFPVGSENTFYEKTPSISQSPAAASASIQSSLASVCA